MADMKCVPGCIPFDGGERKHHRDCPFYPESLTKIWHDREAELETEIERLRDSLTGIRRAAKARMRDKDSERHQYYFHTADAALGAASPQMQGRAGT